MTVTDRTTRTSTTTRRPIVAVATEKVTGTGFLEAAYGGKVHFAKVRESGTMRAWPVLAPGSEARKQAEGVLAQRAEGITVEAIAKGMHKSVPTVRRIITALAFTHELEAMNAKALAALAKEANANREAGKEAPEAPKAAKATEPAKAAKATTRKPRASRKATAAKTAKVAETSGAEAPEPKQEQDSPEGE